MRKLLTEAGQRAIRYTEKVGTRPVDLTQRSLAASLRLAAER